MSVEKYPFYEDPGHGWLRVPLRRIRELGIEGQITRYSYMRESFAYLEEDCDATRFVEAVEARGGKVEYDVHISNYESRIREYDPFNPNRIPFEEIIEGVTVVFEGIREDVVFNEGMDNEITWKGLRAEMRKQITPRLQAIRAKGFRKIEVGSINWFHNRGISAGRFLDLNTMFLARLLKR